MKTTMAVMAMLLSSGVAAAEYRQEYKCYVIDETAVPHVFFVMLKPSLRLSQISKLPGKPILDGLGKPKAYIDKVMECVPLEAQFNSADARFLDDNTPR
ncbi:TapY2 family type IVa secretion system protein [uncultured Ferrimonas sp.]|uniref:TapY2 family type IVa secretion system protein n=1 Tax=uncultured Ferrimonas sp. TaxID=432640 RepID=UPI0026246992|nr:TapY2 family type IVa secretion system protein [uncultured Ferrimonas sp.]